MMLNVYTNNCRLCNQKMLILLKAIQVHRYLTELHDLKYTECIEELSN